MKQISLIFPWRERVHFIRNLIESLKENTKHPSQIEINIAIDDDDVVALHHKPVFEDEFKPFDTHIYIVKRSEHFTKDYVNFLGKQSNGRWIIPINDDCLFKTKNWDQTLVTAMNDASEKIGNDMIVGIIKDDIRRDGEDVKYPHWSCWNVVSRQSIEKIGYIYDERCYVWSVDHIISDLYKEIALLEKKDKNYRRVSLTDIYIEHFSGHTGKRPFDGNYYRMADIERRMKSGVSLEEVKEEAKRIVEIIKHL